MFNPQGIIWADPDATPEDTASNDAREEKSAELDDKAEEPSSTTFDSLSDEVPFAGDAEKSLDDSTMEQIAKSNELFEQYSESLKTQDDYFKKFLTTRLPDLLAEQGFSYGEIDKLISQFDDDSKIFQDRSAERSRLLKDLVDGTFPIPGEESHLDAEQLAELRAEYSSLGAKKNTILDEMFNNVNFDSAVYEMFNNVNFDSAGIRRSLQNAVESAEAMNKEEDKVFLEFLDNPTEQALSNLYRVAGSHSADISGKITNVGGAFDEYLQNSPQSGENFVEAFVHFGRNISSAHDQSTSDLIEYLSNRLEASQDNSRSREAIWAEV